MEFLIILALAFAYLWLVRSNLLQVDLSFPWFMGLVLFGFASLNESFMNWVAKRLGIIYEPIAIVFVTIFLILGIITFLAVILTKLRSRQIGMIRRLAEIELGAQEASSRADGGL